MILFNWGGTNPGSSLLLCQIPVSHLHYVGKQFSFFFAISDVLKDFISHFHSTKIWFSHDTLTKNHTSYLDPNETNYVSS